MSPSLPISRSSSSSSFYFVHPDKNSPSLNGIPDCTKMAHITVLKESHHSKFQLYICSSSCCWYSSSLQKRLYFRGQIDSQVESVESQIDSRGDLLNWCRVLMWAAAVVCDLYIFIMLLLLCWWCWTEWDEGTIQLLLRACTYWKDGHFWIIFCTCPL